MQATAKVFKAGNSQAVRLPKAFRIDATEVIVTKNEVTGDITISKKPKESDLEAFFKLLESAPETEEFIPPREYTPARNPFEDWDEMNKSQKL